MVCRDLAPDSASFMYYYYFDDIVFLYFFGEMRKRHYKVLHLEYLYMSGNHEPML